MVYGVEHKQEKWQTVPAYNAYRPANSKFTQWVIKNSQGIITSETQANSVLIIFSVLMIIVSFLIVFNGSGDENQDNSAELPMAPAEAPIK